jgi:hypothetical protein
MSDPRATGGSPARANNSSAAYGILLLGAVLMFAWLSVTSIALVTRTADGLGSSG